MTTTKRTKKNRNFDDKACMAFVFAELDRADAMEDQARQHEYDTMHNDQYDCEYVEGLRVSARDIRRVAGAFEIAVEAYRDEDHAAGMLIGRAEHIQNNT